MLNNMADFSRFLNGAVDNAVRRAMRSNAGQYEGSWEYHVIQPGTAYTMPNEFVWVKTTKYGSQASVVYANRAVCDVDIKIDQSHATKSSNNLTSNNIDSEFFQNGQHPFFWPNPYYVAGGQRILFTGGTANANTYFVLHGFRPIKERAIQSSRIPFVYTMGWNNIAQSTINVDTCEILRNTKFIITHTICIQRAIDTAGNYMVETPNMSIDIHYLNKPVGPNTLNSEMLFGTPTDPFVLDAPLAVDGGDSIYITGTAPAWGALNRDVFLYFVGVQITADSQLATSL
jgi:hypothetical protein